MFGKIFGIPLLIYGNIHPLGQKSTSFLGQGETSVFKKKSIFFETLENISANLHDAATYFANGVNKPGEYPEFAKQMKALESKGDQFTHTIYIEINKTFITPIEREDILALTTSLDDVLDGIEACSSRMDIYQIQEHDELVSSFANILTQMTHELNTAIQLLSSKKLLKMREHTIKINTLENEADDLLRVAIRGLFNNVKDPIELIKKKELYEMLESATDDCEDVANTLESLIMRNS